MTLLDPLPCIPEPELHMADMALREYQDPQSERLRRRSITRKMYRYESALNVKAPRWRSLTATSNWSTIQACTRSARSKNCYAIHRSSGCRSPQPGTDETEELTQKD
jgi:hypothetical protein